MSLPSRSLRYLKGAGPARAAQLARLGLETCGDLLEHYPRAYIDRSNPTPLAQLQAGREVTAIGTLRTIALRRLRGGRQQVRAILEDETGRVECVWFNQPYLMQRLARGVRLIVSGRVEFFRRLQFTNPEFELLGADGEASGEEAGAPGIVPVYPLTAGISQRMMRRLTRQVLELMAGELEEFLPEAIRARRELPEWARACREIHFPPSPAALAAARRRIAFQELFDLQLLLAVSRALFERPRTARPLAGPGRLLAALRATLPFAPTAAQERALEEVRADLARDCPMHRLLEGDVGSGKTLVALGAALIAVEAGAQVALMAPTEILAAQHAATFAQLAEGLEISVAQLTGGMAPREAQAVREAVAAGRVDIVIGTHALFQATVAFRDLGLVIVDEQHRFGVLQRARLLEKGLQPHGLIMSATPIPRTLAMSLFGDLDISLLDEKPPGRQPPKTHLVDVERYGEMLAFLAEQLAAGAQVYFVAPMISASEDSDLKAAEDLFGRLSGEEPLRRFAGGLLHGRMRGEEKEAVMRAFAAGELRFLVATTVIEVGVDVPNASLMVIEHPERYGLSQLHQLRGRIGRGRRPAHCFLIRHPETGGPAHERLQVLVREDDGFRIAEEDLRQRGPGDFFGVRQSGLPPLKVADPVAQPELLAAAREEALALVRARGVDPLRRTPLWRRLTVRLGAGLELYGVG
jgi:ATP-dependent DNA helicase RecG